MRMLPSPFMASTAQEVLQIRQHNVSMSSKATHRMTQTVLSAGWYDLPVPSITVTNQCWGKIWLSLGTETACIDLWCVHLLSIQDLLHIVLPFHLWNCSDCVVAFECCQNPVYCTQHCAWILHPVSAQTEHWSCCSDAHARPPALTVFGKDHVLGRNKYFIEVNGSSPSLCRHKQAFYVFSNSCSLHKKMHHWLVSMDRNMTVARQTGITPIHTQTSSMGNQRKREKKEKLVQQRALCLTTNWSCRAETPLQNKRSIRDLFLLFSDTVSVLSIIQFSYYSAVMDGWNIAQLLKMSATNKEVTPLAGNKPRGPVAHRRDSLSVCCVNSSGCRRRWIRTAGLWGSPHCHGAQPPWDTWSESNHGSRLCVLSANTSRPGDWLPLASQSTPM